MQKKLTITMDEAVYDALHKVVGRRNISQFLTDLARLRAKLGNISAADMVAVERAIKTQLGI